VRFLGNRSSGKQGYAFARTAVARGARVTLVAANVHLSDPAGAEVVRVGTTEELRVATLKAAADADVVIMAAAPADFRPAAYQTSKIKKAEDGSAPTLELVTNPDIAAELGAAKRPGQVLVAFAAETHDMLVVDWHLGQTSKAALDSGRAKLVRKRADLIVVNEVGEGRAFGTEDNTATVLGADGSLTELGRRPKEELADAVWDLVVLLLG
jgi:phosphopantothenoylcysteine decarboxylase/phosphopantothenate--cysteine ligase